MSSARTQLVLALLLLCGGSKAQSQASAPSVPLASTLTPGETLRYEIEASTSYSADVMEGYSTTAPLGPCQYSLGGVLALKAGSVDPDGNVPVKAEYHDVKVTHWHCRDFDQKKVERGLRDFAASNVVYQVGPHGEVGFQHAARDRFTYLSAVDLLSKVTLDLLQTRLANRPVSIGSSWKPQGQFTYWKDYLLSGLDLSAATMRWKSTPKIGGRDCAWITSKYVFAPTESSSGPVTAGGSLRQQPTNVVAGVLDVSLLFDPQIRHIAWLSRYYKVENHVSVQPEEEPDPEVLTIRWEEEAKARFIPEKDSIAWLAALKVFESTPEPGAVAAQPAAQTGTSVAELARKAVPNKRSSTAEMDTLDFTPQGFTRWEREFCDSSWYCTKLSIALPGEVKVAEDAPLQTAYLSRIDGSLLTVTVGPILQRKYQGLTAEEELKKQTDFYLANQIWMTNKPGISIESQSTSVDGYSAMLTTFRGERRDLVGIHGELAILLSPWGESFPITCTVEQGKFATLHATCERILGLVRVRRAE